MAAGLRLLRTGGLLATLCLGGAYNGQAQALSRSFVCFGYDRDSAEFPPRCVQIIAAFARIWASFRGGHEYPFLPAWDPNAAVPLPPRTFRVDVYGHAFEEGDPNNLALLRATRVVRELVRLGVAEELISLRGFTDRPLMILIPGEDSAPQNRRTELLFR